MPSFSRVVLASTALFCLPILGACSAMSDTTSAVDGSYAAGVSADLGSLTARGLVIVGEKGEPGVLSGALINDSSAPIKAIIQTPGQTKPTEFEVPANSILSLGAESNPVVLTGALAEQPGGLAPVGIGTGPAGVVTVQVPVLPPTGEYATVTPSIPPTNTPSLTQPSPSKTPSLTPSSTPSQSLTSN